jgi:chaperonin cofactor prefoldin
MIKTIWEQLLAKLQICEVEEAKYLLGPSRIEELEAISREIENLLSFFDEIPSQFKDLSFHKNKVDFYLNKLTSKAKELGLDTKDLISLKTPREKFIFEFLAEGGSTRPSTSESLSRQPTIEKFESFTSFKGDMICFIEDHREDLKKALDSEYEFLKNKAEAIQNELIGITSIPTVREVNDFTKKLEDAVLNDVHPALFQRSGKDFFKPEEEKVELDWDFEVVFKVSKDVEEVPVCKPKLREVRRHSRPGTASIKIETSDIIQTNGNGKVSRRLRNLVNDHRGLPV